MQKSSVYRCTLIIITLLLFADLSVHAFAAGQHRFETEEVTAEEQATFLENREFVLLSEPNPSDAIYCFTASEKGWIALGVHDGESHSAVYVYDYNGSFVYGYRFVNHGGAFVIYFQNDLLWIYTTRNRYLAGLDRNGNCVDIKKVVISRDNNELKETLRYPPTSGKIMDSIYYLEKDLDFGQPFYSRLIIEKADGSMVTAYDASNTFTCQIVLVFIAISVFFTFVITGIIRQFRHKIRKNN